MPDLHISQSDIDNLGQKLSMLESHLSDNERGLLVAIFAVAADAIARSPRSLVVRISSQDTPVAVHVEEGPLPPIGDQFVNAFTAGPIEDLDVQMKIGGEPLAPPIS
jgi:hypothetical protein